MGQYDINDFFDNAPYLGPILFFTYMVSIQMVMINLFVGLICEVFAEVGEGGGQDDESDDGNEKPNLLSFVKGRVKSMGNKDVEVVNPIYSDWKDEWDVMMDSFVDRCDNCMYVLRNMAAEQTRQGMFFTENIDEKKKEMLTAVIGVDYYLYDTEFSDGIQVVEKRIRDMSLQQVQKFKLKAAIKKADQYLELIELLQRPISAEMMEAMRRT